MYGLFLNETDYNSMSELIVVSNEKDKLKDHYKKLENDLNHPLLEDETEIETASKATLSYYTINEVKFI